MGKVQHFLDINQYFLDKSKLYNPTSILSPQPRKDI